MLKFSFIFFTWEILISVALASLDQQSCGVKSWKCDNGQCIFLVGRCDNYTDCADESDEKGCESVVCKKGQRPCSSGECINAKFFCDGIINCRDASDEFAADCRGVNTPKSTAQTSIEAPKQTPNKVITWTPYPVDDTTMTPSTSKVEQRQKQPDREPLFTAAHINKQTTTHEPLLPDIIVPAYIPDIPAQPKEIFSATTRKHNIPNWTISRETTTFKYQPRGSTLPYWFHWYNTTYQPTTTKTPCIEADDRFEFCRKRYRGYYRHPNDCKQYIVCEWGFMYICTCPDSTHWDLRALTCVWENSSPCITGHYDKPIIADQTATPVRSTATQIKITSFPSTLTSSTTSSTLYSTLPDIVPPLVRLRALPATPAWLKELSAKTLSSNNEPSAPQYQSLMSRFFKAMPHVTDQLARLV